VEDRATPQNLAGLWVFLGLVGSYLQYISDFAGIAQPLNRLTAKGVHWQWSHAEQQAFDRLKGCLIKSPVLAYPNPAKEYILDTDASNYTMGAYCHKSRVEVVVAYYGKALSSAKKNYCTTRKKLLEVIKAVKQFQPHLYEKMFQLRTSHALLIWMCKRVKSFI